MNKIEKYTKIRPPYMHLVMGTEFDFIELTKEFSEIENIEVKIVDGSKCISVEALFNEFATKFQFPEYFGHNWAALDECLNDLDWFEVKGYILFITKVTEILNNDDENFKFFVNLLKDTVSEWTEGRNCDDLPTVPTSFHIIFLCTENEGNRFKKRLMKANLKNIVEILFAIV